MRFSEQMAGSARALNALLHQFTDEPQILRIDHFLDKQPVLDIQVLRFANSLLEHIWNREHVATIQITLFEEFGWTTGAPSMSLWGRYETSSRTTLLQVLAVIAMEPPVGSG